MDTLENYRKLASGLLEIYLSRVSNRMNEVMKVLTVITTILNPITFIAGVYGMNFEFMQELKWEMGICAGVGGDDCNDRCHAMAYPEIEMVVKNPECPFLTH